MKKDKEEIRDDWVDYNFWNYRPSNLLEQNRFLGFHPNIENLKLRFAMAAVLLLFEKDFRNNPEKYGISDYKKRFLHNEEGRIYLEYYVVLGSKLGRIIFEDFVLGENYFRPHGPFSPMWSFVIVEGDDSAAVEALESKFREFVKKIDETKLLPFIEEFTKNIQDGANNFAKKIQEI